MDDLAMGGAPDEPSTIAARAAGEIVRRITHLELPPGSSFTERELAEQLELGKAPVREALLQLSWSGLVSPKAGAGYVVAPITVRSARELFELWRIVEVGVAREAVAAGRWPDETVDEKISEVGGDPLGKELVLHILVVGALQNTVVMSTWGRVHMQLERLLRFAERLGGDLGLGAGHRQLLAAGRTGDADAAAAAVRAHIEAVESKALNALLRSDALQDTNLAGVG